MNQTRTPIEVLELYYGAMRDKSADDFAELYAMNAVHEFSFFTPNGPPRLEGREAVRSSYKDRWRNHPLMIKTINSVFIYQATDPEVVIAQWLAQAALSTASERAVEITGLLVLRVKDGLIVHTRDFMDSLGILHALGHTPNVPKAE